MLVYWGMLVWVFLIGWFQPDEKNPLKSNEAKAYRATWGTAVMLIAPIIFFAAVRGKINDTAAYMKIFSLMPDDMLFFKEYVSQVDSSSLYYGIQMMFKCFITDDVTLWLSLMAIVEGLLVAKFFQKYSPNIAMSMYIFMASTLFTWMYNGIRQFLAVTILMAMTEWIIENKWYYYIPVALLIGGVGPVAELIGFESVPWFLGGIHQSAYLMIPVFFMLRGGAWNWKIWLFVFVFVVLAFTGLVDDFVGDVAEETEYASDFSGKDYEMDDGAHPVRALVAAVPVAMAAFKRKEIEETEDLPEIVPICINASVITLALYVTSTLAGSGVLIGRLPMYTELYDLVLIPWLVLHPYKKSSKLLTTAVFGAYIFWFIYQMYISWGGLAYGSDVLNIYLNWYW